MNTHQKQLIVSFHDLHPESWECCQKFIERCKSIGTDKMSLLVIPQYHGAPPFSENQPFVDWLKNLPSDQFDLCLHGYYHQAERVRGGWFQQLKGNVYTQGEGEFYQLDKQQAQDKLEAGMRLFHPHELKVYGFTAPAWLCSEEAKQTIRDNGFLYNTLWDGVELTHSNIFIKAPTLVYSSRNAWRRIVSKIWIDLFHWYNRNAHVLRLAVHPIDFQYPHIENHLYRVLEKALQTRTSVTYRDLIPQADQKPVTLAAS